jgi:hypothetical protein
MMTQLITLGLLLFLLTDLVLIIMCLASGPKLRWLCRVALWANGTLLALEMCIFAVVLYQSKPDERGIALVAAVGGCMPTLVAFLSFAAIYRWRMNPKNPPPIPR